MDLTPSPEHGALIWNAIIIFGTGVAVYVGKMLHGREVKSEKANRGKTVELAGAVVDSRDIDRLILSNDKNSVCMQELKIALDRNSDSLERNSETADSVRDVGRDLGKGIEHMVNEMRYGKRP